MIATGDKREQHWAAQGSSIGNVQNKSLLLRRYSCAVTSTAIALELRILLTPWLHERFPYGFMYFAITLTAWYGGLGPALLAMVLGYLGLAYYVIPPYHSFRFANIYDFIGFLLFVFLGLANILFSESLRRAQFRAEANAQRVQEAADALRASEAERLILDAQRRESEERLHLAAEAARLGVWNYEEKAGYITLSPHAAEAFGLPGQLHTLTQSALLGSIYGEDRPLVIQAMRATLDNHAVFDTEFRVVWPDQSVHWIAAKGQALADGAKERVVFSGVVQDITLRKQGEQERATHLAEIEALNGRLKIAMAETHHRVKNNLQVIAAMIDMQTMNGTPTLSSAEFVRLSRHVHALATIHEILTREAKEYGDAQTFSARALIKQLLATLQLAHAEHPLRQQVDEALLSTRQGSALALIINELVSNAVKHGSGAIEVRFVIQENHAALSVCDSGSGFPAEFDAQKAANTGLELVQTLTQTDLAGDITYINRAEGGACVRVIFALSSM